MGYRMKRTYGRVPGPHSKIGHPRDLVWPTGNPSVAPGSAGQFELEFVHLPGVKPVAPVEVAFVEALAEMWARAWVEAPVRGVERYPRAGGNPQGTMHR